MNPLVEVIDGAQEVLGICPCCGDIFRLVEAKFIFPKRKTRPSEYLDVEELEAQLSAGEVRLSLQEERFEDGLEAKRETLRALGRKQAKQRLRRIDPVFSGRKVDPQDVRVVFDPVEFVVFHGLNAGPDLSHIELVSRVPVTKNEETVADAIGKTIRNGNVDFETLQLDGEGRFRVEKASVV